VAGDTQLLTLSASKGERVTVQCLSVCLSVPSIKSSSDVPLVGQLARQLSIDRGLSVAVPELRAASC